MKQIKFIDLFAGLGGFRIALESLDAKCVYSSDNDANVQKVYQDNFNEKPDGDITIVDEKNIPNHDVLCAGFPCQPFSIGGYRKGFEDTRGTLFFDIERILRSKQPQAFILENVKGLVNHDKGRTLETIFSKLATSVNGVDYNHTNNLGYKVWYKVLNSKDFGVAQNRERIYIVGIKNQKTNYTFPETNKIKPKKLSDVLAKNNNDPNLKVASNVISQIFDQLETKKYQYTIDTSRPLIAYEVRPSRCTFRQDDLSPTLTAKMGTGGNNVPIYVQEMRKLSVEECLELQGFPKNYKLTPNKMQSYKQIGNSLSVPVVSSVAKNLFRELKKVSGQA